MSIYVSFDRYATTLRNFHVASMSNVQQAACKTVSHARNTIASAAYCMDIHDLFDVALAYGFEEHMRSTMVSYLTDSILANSSDPVIKNLIDDTPATDYSATEEPIEDYYDSEYTDSDCAFASPRKPMLILDVLNGRNTSEPTAPVSEKKVKFADQSANEMPTLMRTVSKIDAFQTPIKQLETLVVPQKKLDWADITDEDDKLNTAIAEKAKQKRDKLTWALRIKLANVPDKDLDAAIKAAQSEKSEATQVAELKITQSEKPEDKSAEAKKTADAKYKKFHSMTPVKPAKKISNDDVKAQIAERKAEQEDANAGFIKVGGKRRSAAPSKPQKFVSNNKRPENEKKITSGRYLFGACDHGNAIMSETDDWFLWDYNVDEQGLAVPIGWRRLSVNKFKINNKSSFVHTRHADGSWTHEEEVPLENDPTGKKFTLVPVSVDYLLWFLTPPHMRRGACPDE